MARLFFYAYFYPYSGETVHDVASVSKSITTSLIGLALEKGYIKDLNHPVIDFFPEQKATIWAGGKWQGKRYLKQPP